ncbi:YbaN family protein [Sphingobium cloacae]|uniref:DUF454 domain-containing protein n=1 Tax=Sphingobium cloacae TaxID=120107 RepID=A0A1E1EYP8_9SPHN|nr:YbaN family protein [Sphingobium cloacae]BAV63383.1 hypothetical protein SCLO_1003430 [Sphingobium cloacae]
MQDLPEPERGRHLRLAWLAGGILCVGLGFIGALLPLMPTTIFLILAAGCFARSSPRLEVWLLDHPRFGPSLRMWREQRAIPRHAKVAACGGIALGYALFLLGAHPDAVLALAVAFALLCCAGWIISRPAQRIEP